MGVYKDKDGYWYIDYYYDGKRIRKKASKLKKSADKILVKVKAQIAENRYLDIKKEKKIKFEDFANEYLKIHSKQNKSYETHDAYHVKILKEYFGNKQLGSITLLMVQKFKMERVKEVSHATVNRHLACLKSMFNRAIEWGRATENPVKKVKLFKENNKRIRYLEKEEISKLIRNCNKYLKPIVMVALNTGMRRGEILNLMWQDVDFKREIMYLTDTKNGETREVPINKTLKTVLVQINKHPDSPYVFCKTDGKPYANVRKSFFTALDKSCIINFRFHDLRHTFASQLVMNGVDLNTVRELLGHKSMQMTLRYAHLSPDFRSNAVKSLDGNFMDSNMDSKPHSREIAKEADFDNLLKLNVL